MLLPLPAAAIFASAAYCRATPMPRCFRQRQMLLTPRCCCAAVTRALMMAAKARELRLCARYALMPLLSAALPQE
jgi:hypothetical protein